MAYSDDVGYKISSKTEKSATWQKGMEVKNKNLWDNFEKTKKDYLKESRRKKNGKR